MIVRPRKSPAPDVPADWLEQHTSRAPTALRARVLHYDGPARAGTLPHNLALAGRAALAHVLSHAGDRSVALDLLAADALITLALLAQAEHAPEQLEEFALSILQETRADP